MEWYAIELYGYASPAWGTAVKSAAVRMVGQSASARSPFPHDVSLPPKSLTFVKMQANLA
jgi:hypothetical protein